MDANSTSEFRRSFVIRISSFVIVLFCSLSLASAQTNRLSTLAGSTTPGFQEGSRGSVRFHWPAGLTTDAEGNIYVADAHNHVIRKLTPTGVSSTFAGSGQPGSGDGSGINVQFNAPQGVAVDSLGNFYVADTGNHAIRKITADGTVSLFAGIVGDPGNADGTGSNAQFNHPQGLAVDSANNLFVADTWNHLIRKITPSGIVSTIAGLVGVKGSTDSTNSKARFYWPSGITVDDAGNLYVADYGNHIIRRMTVSGTNWTTKTIAGFPGLSGNADGTNNTARFFEPLGIATDNSGSLYVVDSGNQTIRKISTSGTNWIVSTILGSGENGYADGLGNAARLNWPCGIAIDPTGHIYIADAGNNSLRVDRLVPPLLRTVFNGNQFTLFWSILDSQFTLETSSNLVSGAWTPLTNGLMLSGDDYVFTNGLSSDPSVFYRLRAP